MLARAPVAVSRPSRRALTEVPPDAPDVLAWLHARTVADPNGSQLAVDLYLDYVDWLRRWPVSRPLAAAVFHQALDAHGFDPPEPSKAQGLLLRRGLRLVEASIDDTPPKALQVGRARIKPTAEVGRLRLLIGQVALHVDRAPLTAADPLAAEIRKAAGRDG